METHTEQRNLGLLASLVIFVSIVFAQSGDGELPTPAVPPVVPVRQQGEAVPLPSLADYGDNSYRSGHYPANYEEYGYYNYDDYYLGRNESESEDFLSVPDEDEISPDDLANPVMFPQEPSVCMPPIYADNESVDYVTKASSQAPRRILSYQELKSTETRKAVMLAVEYYIQEKEGAVNLEMTEIKSGCRQILAGILYFFVFDAKETIFCDTTAVNATCTENSMHSRECRARVHRNTTSSWLPFFTECHDPEFYQIDRKSVRIRYV